MSDRLCIFTAGAQKFTFAPEELISCCSACGFGCNGGYLLQPFEYWQSTGIPSGGDEGSNYVRSNLHRIITKKTFSSGTD